MAGTIEMTPGRRTALAVGLVVALTLIAFGSINVASALGQTTERISTTYRLRSDRLSVDVGSGDLRIVGDSGREVRVTTRLRYGLWKPAVEASSTATGLRLASSCHWLGFCDVDYTIAVPAGTALDLVTSSGDVTVRDVTGTVVARTSSGDMVLERLTGASVEARSSSGDVRATDVTGRRLALRASSGDIRGVRLGSSEVAARASSGDVRLDLRTAPDRVAAHTGSGDVRVELPRPEDGYHVRVDTGSGDATVEVPVNDGSDREIEATTGSGDVRLVQSAG